MLKLIYTERHIGDGSAVSEEKVIIAARECGSSGASHLTTIQNLDVRGFVSVPSLDTARDRYILILYDEQ